MLILKHVDFLSVDAMERLPEQVSKSDASSFEFGPLDECLIRITKEMNVRDTCATFCLPTAYLFKVTPRMRRRVVQVSLFQDAHTCGCHQDGERHCFTNKFQMVVIVWISKAQRRTSGHVLNEFKGLNGS